MSGANVFAGELNARGMRFGIAVSRFNDFITEPLLSAAVATLRHYGAAEQDVRIVRVPGAFELPLAAQRLAVAGKYDAVIALGCVIRGGTPHFEYVAGECAAGLTQVALKFDVPVCFGVLTTDTIEQAQERAGGKEGNKGADAAMTAIEMVQVLRQLDAY
jgi:6,7-dimethyl-8-ribityllumazine synthase